MKDLIALRNNLTQFYKDGKIDEATLNMNLNLIDSAIEDFNYYKSKCITLEDLYIELINKLIDKIKD